MTSTSFALFIDLSQDALLDLGYILMCGATNSATSKRIEVPNKTATSADFSLYTPSIDRAKRIVASCSASCNDPPIPKATRYSSFSASGPIKESPCSTSTVSSISINVSRALLKNAKATDIFVKAPTKVEDRLRVEQQR